jgi:hypothetical protein
MDVLKEVRDLIRVNILPRLTELEEQVRLLRRVTWPVCQTLRARDHMSETKLKQELLEYLDLDEIQWLLNEKKRVSVFIEPSFSRNC